MELTDESKPLTGFETPWGLFLFITMLFGLVIAEASFYRLIHIVLRGLENVDNFVTICGFFLQWEKSHDVFMSGFR